MTAYIPRQGDIIAITFDPQSGHEQKGRRLASEIDRFSFPSCQTHRSRQ